MREPALYRVAYEESQRALDDQLDELNGMRGRAMQYIAFVGAAIAFLAGTGLTSIDRDRTFDLLAIAASAASITTIGLAVCVLWPRSWDFRLSAQILIDRWIEQDVPGPSEADLLRGLAQKFDEMQVANEKPLRTIRRQYVAMACVGAAAILLWIWLVWAKA